MQWLNTLWEKYRSQISFEILLGTHILFLLMGGGLGYALRQPKAVSECESSVEEEVSGIDERFVEVDADEVSVCVDVGGAVTTPGVYCSSTASKLGDFIQLADGLNKSLYADKYVAQSINLATKVSDGDKVYIPFQEDTLCEFEEVESPIGKDGGIITADVELDSSDSNTDSPLVSADSDSDAVDCVDLNTASLEELIGLSGIGESTANNIINARPFSTIADLLDVTGIGDSKYAQVKDYVCVE